MSMKDIIFYLLAGYIMLTGILAVTTRKIFRSAIWLLASLIGIAGLYFWMELEFIAAVQIVVYVGGIVVLIIFSIFLTQKAGNEMPKTDPTRLIASVLASLLGVALTINLIMHHNFQIGSGNFQPQVSDIGLRMLNTGDGGYALPFEAVSVLLLAAMIGCIVIAMKVRKEETVA